MGQPNNTTALSVITEASAGTLNVRIMAYPPPWRSVPVGAPQGDPGAANRSRSPSALTT